MEATQTIFEYLLDFVRIGDPSDLEKKSIEDLIREGCGLLPLGKSVKEGIARGWGVAEASLERMSDDQILSLAFRNLEEEEVLSSLISHARIVDAYFSTFVPLGGKEGA